MDALQKNLDALARWLPELPDLIGQVPVPPGFERTAGTDGTPTFLCRHDPPPRRLQWLGHTSMPAASADALAASLDPGTSNGLGLGIGTGYEWLALAKRLPRPQMLFLYEPDPATLRMALEICDLSPLFAAGRIILLPPSADAPAVAAALDRFLQQHRGFEAPTLLHPLPTLGARRNELLAAGEAIVRHALLRRHALNESLTAQFLSQPPAADAPPVAFLLSERYPGERPLHNASQHLPHLHLDRHDQSALALRLQTLLDHNPSAILSDLFRSQLALPLPPSIAVETWIPPGIGAAFWERLPAASTLAPRDRIIVHGHHHAALLREHSFPDGQILLRPLAIPTVAPRLARANPGQKIAIFADLPRIRPDALGITLPTHLAVYNAARALIDDDYLTLHDGSTADLLRRALDRAGIGRGGAGPDPALADAMRRLIRHLLIPTLPLLRLATEIERAGLPLLRLGDWPEHAAPTAWPTPDSELWQDIAAVVHLSPTGTLLPPVLQAAARGIPVVAPQHPTDRLTAAAPAILGDRLLSVPPAQLLPTLKRLLRERRPAGAA